MREACPYISTGTIGVVLVSVSNRFNMFVRASSRIPIQNDLALLPHARPDREPTRSRHRPQGMGFMTSVDCWSVVAGRVVWLVVGRSWCLAGR
jgi:hypothetical protein